MAVRQYTVNAIVDQKRLQLSAKTALASQTIKIPVDVEAKGITDLKVASTTMNKLKDSAGNTRVEIEKFNSSGQKLGTTIKNTSKDITTLGQDFISTLGKVAKFGAVTAILSGFTASIGEAVSVVKDLDDAMVDYEKVSDLSGDSMSDYVDKLSELGDAVYRNKIEMTESATIMKQAGYSDEDSAKLAQMANLYMNISDEQVSASDSASMLIGQMKAFNISANDSIKILDGINEVSNNYAVSSSDLANNLGVVSSTLAATGTTFSESLGMLTAITEKTRNASTAAHSLQQISARLTQTLDDNSSTGKKLIDIYNGLGISLKDQRGQIKSTYGILSELAPKWNELSKNQQEYIALTSAGSRQQNNFIALMSNFNTAINANTTALESSGSAWEENSKRAESLTTKLSMLKKQFVDLVTGDGGISSFLKILIDLGTNLLKFANSDIGQVVIKVTLLITTITLLSKAFDLLKASALKNVTFDHFIAWIQIATSGTYGFKIALDQLKLSILSNPLFIGTLIFVGITKFIKYCNENAESVENLKKHIDELETSTKSLQSEYNTLSSKSNLTEAEQNRLALLNAQIEANKILIQQEAQKAYNKQYREESDAEDTSRATRGGRVVNTDNKAEKTEIDSLIESYNELNNTKSKNLDQDDESISKKAELIKSLTEEADRLNKAKENGVDLYDDDEKRLDQINDIIDSYNEENGTLDNNSNAISDSTNEIENSSDSLKDLASSIGMTTTELENNASAMNMSVDEYADMVSQQNELNDSLDNIQSTYGILAGAVDEYNKNGYYSIDTLQKLLKLDPQYLTMLQNDNGQMKVNTSTLQANINKKLESAKTTIYDTAMKKLNALESEHEATALNADYTQRRLHVGIVREETNALSDNTKQKVLNKAASLKGKGIGTSGVDKVISEMNSQLSAVANTVKGLNVDFRTATNTATSGTKKATNAVKKQISAEDKLAEKLKKKKEHLEDIKDNYETVFDYMKDVVEEEIDKLNDKRDKEIAKIDKKRKKLEETYTKEKNSINTQITMLEWEEEARLKAYDETINSLNSQKDAVEDYYDTEIEKLQNVNDEISDQIKLQEYQEALARAKASKKMVLGESGFEYRVDEESVASKTQDLQQYQSEKARKDAIEALKNQKEIQVSALESQIAYQEKMKAETQEYYDTEIEKLNARLDALENSYDIFNTKFDNQEDAINTKYDNLITTKEKYLEKLEKAEKQYERIQAKQLSKILYGKNFENQTNNERLINLQAFVTAYNSILSQLGNIGSTTSSGGGTQTTKKKDSGDSSIDKDGAYIVGDSPNTELVIGSKLNGIPMNLSKGTGVVNAKSTKTLAGLLNNINGLSPNTTTNSTRNVSQDIVIENVNLNNVTDGQSFINEIKQFRNNMIQKSYSF